MSLFFCIGVMKGIVNIISKDGNQTRANTPVNISEKSKISPKNTPRPIRNAFGFPDTIADKVDTDKEQYGRSFILGSDDDDLGYNLKNQ